MPVPAARLKVTSFNLQIFAAPPDTAFDDPPYSSEAWERKLDFVRETVLRLRPDVVAFQEVFSIPALRDLCESLGLPHLTTAGLAPKPGPRPGNFLNATNAVASRLPFEAEFRLEFPDTTRSLVGLAPDYDYSRPPVAAVVEVPDGGPVTVVSVHLKSKRPDMEVKTYSAETAWEDRLLDTMLRTSAGSVRSMLRRGAEAAAVYAATARMLHNDPGRAVVLLGDMNDNVTSVTLDALTMRGRLFRIGADGPSTWPEGLERRVHSLRLADAAIITARPDGGPRRGTHVHDDKPEVLDYALVSNAMNPANPRSTWRPGKLTVLDAHIYNPERADSSDHAVVSLDFERKAPA